MAGTGGDPVVHGQIGAVRVVVAHQPGSRSVATTTVRSVGTTAERPGEQGYVHLAEHLVHQYARTDSGELVESLHSRVGGVSNAQSYPFHTEFTSVVPAESLTETSLWWDCAVARLRWPDVSQAAVTSEAAVLEQEVSHRLGLSPVAGFPWVDALGTLSDDFGLAHDGFTDLTEIRLATPERLRAMWSDVPASAAVALVTPWRPNDVAAHLGLLPHVAPPAEFRPPFTGPRIRVSSVPTPVPVRAEVRWLPDPEDRPREHSRAAAVLAARVLDACDATGRWQPGLFGPWLGPDHGLLIRQTVHSTDVSGASMSTPEQLADARTGALVDLHHLLASTATFSALLARDALHGFDTAAAATHLRSLTAAEVHQTLAAVAATQPGHLLSPALSQVPA